MRFAFIKAEKANYPLNVLCRTMLVSTSAFHAWAKAEISARKLRDEYLKGLIRKSFNESRHTYGSPRIYRELVSGGVKVSEKRVARLMAEMGLVAQVKRRFKRTTDSDHDNPIAPNLLERDFSAPAPNRVWVGDITYLWTCEGWVYLAVVIDLYSRRVVGWALADHMRTELCTAALLMAIGLRSPPPGLIFHSDRGSQYASAAYRSILTRYGAQCSMSGRGDCYDNAVVESFFGTLKQELVYRQGWLSRRQITGAVTEYIAMFYNPRRRHSYCDGISPMDFEAANVDR